MALWDNDEMEMDIDGDDQWFDCGRAGDMKLTKKQKHFVEGDANPKPYGNHDREDDGGHCTQGTSIGCNFDAYIFNEEDDG